MFLAFGLIAAAIGASIIALAIHRWFEDAQILACTNIPTLASWSICLCYLQMPLRRLILPQIPNIRSLNAA